MAKRASIAVLLFCLFGCLSASAQLPVPNVCPYTQHAKSLACLIPDVTVTGADKNLAGFNTAIAQVLGQLPLAAPVSGVVIGFNKKLAVPEDITENLGTILTERGNTVGKYKLFAGFTYQRFVFDTVDGSRLSNLPIVFSQAASNTQAAQVGYAQNALSANITQYTGIIAFGLTDRIDVSAIVPFERISASAGYNNLLKASTSNCNFGGANVCGPSTLFTSNTVSGSARGFGDVILVVKGTVVSGERSKLAAGLETRFPTGDVFNLLGTGAYGVKPYLVFSRFWGRFTPHANVGYQWNGFSVLRQNPNGGGNLRMPDILEYSAGADVGIIKRKLSVVGDFLSQHYFDAPRITPAVASTGLRPDPSPVPGLTIKSIGVATSSYNVNDASVGLKWSPKGNLIISANALIKLNDAGLRAKFVPLAGISYRFGH